VMKGYSDRARNSKLTGEWIIFAKHDDRNYYLTLGVHGDDAAIWDRCRSCADEFPELAILREDRPVT
jgi:hypothetical protein